MENRMELNAVKGRVIQQLNAFYDGDLWVTHNFKSRIFSLSSDEANKTLPGNTHSIAQLTAHMIAWRNFGLQKLTGNNDFDIEDNTPGDWPVAGDWMMLLQEFEACHANLVSAIQEFPVGKLHATVPGRDYTFLFLLNGIVEHDYYHYGQIGSVLAGINRMK